MKNLDSIVPPNALYQELKHALGAARTDRELFKKIVDAPFTYKPEMAFLFLGIIVFLLVNKKDGTIDRIALSDTELAQSTTNVSAVPFRDIKIPADDPENIIATAIRIGKSQDTTDWKYLFTPALKPEQARINQASAGIAYSAVYPLQVRDGAALIFSYFQYQEGIGAPQQDFMQRYASLAADQLKI